MLLQVTKQLGGVVQGLDKVLASMDLEKVRGICREVGDRYRYVYAEGWRGERVVLCTLSSV